MSSAEILEPKRGKDDNVRVAIRCRPLNDREKRNGNKTVVQMDQVTGQVIVQNPKAHGEKEKAFTFDTVFDGESKQVDVYNETARPIIEFALEGYNGTIFAYGQTGTGKTYTMEGYPEPEKRGIIPNSFAHIFGHISKCEGEVQFLVRVSYLEIYNEEVRDILRKPSPNAPNAPKLEIRERADVGVYVKDLQSFVVKNADEMDKLMTIGNKNRVFAATNMNDRSSRSHVIFSITIERSDLGADNKHHVRMGKLHLVDLAGSERQCKTGAQGERFMEAVKINLSLSTLGNVISALVDGHSTHIPYRNSKLTRLLQDSLGGNSKTVMIANIGPSEYNSDETLNTLRYANRAKNIKNNAHINEDPKDAMLREFQKEISELKLLLEAASGSEGSEDESDVSSSDHTHRRRRYKRTESAGSLSPRTMALMKAKIEEEKAKLMATKGLAEGERNQAQKELEKREEELQSAQQQQLELEMKLKELNSKVIKGGVNLLEQAEEQEKLLESSAKELEKRKKAEGKLKEKLQKKEEEKLDIEEKYTTLQDEAASKTRILKEVWKQFQHTKEEIADMKAEAQQEKDEMLAMIRAAKREVGLQTLIIDSYIPHEYQEQLESVVQWQEETGEWHMPGIPYAGNNMRKQKTPEPDPKMSSYYDTTMAYLTYGVGQYEVQSLLSSTTASSSNPSSTGRPKAARKAAATTTSKPKKKEEKEPEEEYPKTRGLVSRQQRFA